MVDGCKLATHWRYSSHAFAVCVYVRGARAPALCCAVLCFPSLPFVSVQHRANILHQCRGWAKTNKEVERLLPQLEAMLDKQTLADGSRPVLPVARSVEAGAEAADAAAAAVAGPRRQTRSSSAAAAAAATVDDADADEQLDAPEEAAADDEEAEAADQEDF